MLIVLGVITIAMIISGAIMIRYCDDYASGVVTCGLIATFVGSVLTIAVIIVALIHINSLVQISTIDEKIVMYEEQNAKIEEQIETVVKQYQEYESGIVADIGNRDSYITLISLYPELKADTLVSKEIEVYLNNNQTIAELKNQKLDERIYRWWLYFGS